jgi:hypothetical protein
MNLMEEGGRDGALRRPRRVQRRKSFDESSVLWSSFRPLYGRGRRSAPSLPNLRRYPLNAHPKK